MSSEYCSIEEAWSEKKKKTKKETKENKYTVPTVGIPEPFVATVDTSSRPDANEGPGNFFPLPGETAGDDDWARAFTLGPSAGIPGTVNVAGGPTLWRQQQQSLPLPSIQSASSISSIPSTLSGIPYDIQQRFDELAKQLDALSHSNSFSYSSSPMQNTAELFLFVAIGLLLLLAIDTLLRCATMVAIGTMKKQKGGFGFKMPRSGVRRW
jgi:hypothetical protein